MGDVSYIRNNFCTPLGYKLLLQFGVPLLGYSKLLLTRAREGFLPTPLRGGSVILPTPLRGETFPAYHSCNSFPHHVGPLLVFLSISQSTTLLHHRQPIPYTLVLILRINLKVYTETQAKTQSFLCTKI